ncbi:hypothetical protein [Xanthomonas sp. WHRI 6106]|uniref:hypothetical protein n=1 Tax=Xanthomonas sp. WHRI 6106 TaxID=3161566 RepID=UPI0032E87979
MSINSIASSGMQVAALRQQVAASVVDASADPSAPATDLVEGLSARNDFQANATALRRSDEMLGSLLDVLT